MIKDLIEKASALWATILKYPIFRRRTFPIESLDSVTDFAITRAAFVAQKTMLGYVKTRMGIAYPEMFRDDLMNTSLKLSIMHHYSACLGDLTIFVFRVLSAKYNLSNETCEKEALKTFHHGLTQNLDPEVELFNIDSACDAFRIRITRITWRDSFNAFILFKESPSSLTRWAPIAEEFKIRDKEIAQNSVSFAWIDVRKDFLNRLAINVSIT